MHEVLVNRLGGLSLPRKSVVRLTDRPDITFDVYRGRKTTMPMPKTYGQLKKSTHISRFIIMTSLSFSGKHHKNYIAFLCRCAITCVVTHVIALRHKKVVVVLLFYVHGTHLMSCRDGQLT